MPIACIAITHLALKCELLRQPELRGKAALIAGHADDKRVVLARSPEARAVSAGMPLEQAMAVCPQAQIVEGDLQAYRDAWERVLGGLEQRSPIVEDAELGIAYVDLRGLEAMYGGEAKLVHVLLSAVPQAYRPRAGVAEGKFPAYAAALQASPGGAVRLPADAAPSLAPLPVRVLPTGWQVKQRLVSFGLHTLGDVARLPFQAMQGEFGKEGARLWRLAHGNDDTPLQPRRHEERVSHSLSFAAPTASLPAILMAIDTLLARAYGSPDLRGRFARAITLQGQVSFSARWEKQVSFHEPVGTKDRAFTILRGVVERLTLPGPLESLSLTLAGLTGEAGHQESLFSDVRRRAQLDDAVRQLRARLRMPAPLYRIQELEPWSRIPERRRALVPYEP